MFLIDLGYRRQTNLPQVGKVILFKRWVSKMISGQTTGEFTAITPK